MCGIVCTNTNTKPDVLAASVAHRGTYTPECVFRDGFTFCHTLMPVQGNSPVKQPFGDGAPYTLLFQGELWDHPGSASDTEYLFQELCATNDVRGTVNRLNGMFAFVFSNGTDLWFASDIFGEQPLYFYHGGTRGFFPCLSIASEMKQLLVCGALLNKIKPCAPGKLYHYSFATGALEVETYHAFDYTQARTDVVDYEKIRKLLRRSCKKKYGAVALQQTALLLSGGVDSAIIAYELSKLGITQAFTVSIDLDSIDFRTAEVAAAQCGLHLTKVLCKTLDPDRSIVMSESKNRSVVEEYVCHLALAKCLAEQNYRVVFTGSGADEIFVGYPYYLRFFSRNNMSLLQSKLIESYHSRELRVLNKVYMSYAIECRSPFLDRTLANYALTLDINKCLVDKGRMKAALRDAYCDVIASAQNEKIIAGRSMGVIDYFAERNGGMDARVYHPRYAEIFSSVGEVFGLLEKVRAVEYEIV